jgi:beta-glucosidase
MRKLRTMKRARPAIISIILALSMVFAGPVSVVLAEHESAQPNTYMESGNLDKNGIFSNPYTKLSDALADAAIIHQQVADEGTALLKNNGALPLEKGTASKLTLFNSTELGFTAGFLDVGFEVNALTGIPETFTPEQLAAIALYNDAAVIRIMRASGEQNDSNTGSSTVVNGLWSPTGNTYGAISYVDAEGHAAVWDAIKAANGQIFEAWPDGTSKGWIHKQLAPNQPLATFTTASELATRDTTPVRHHLMLTLAEEKMIQLIKPLFDTVIIVYDSCTPMEMGDLQDDPAIDAIIAAGRMTSTTINNPAKTAAKAVGRVIAGIVNPSAQLVDQWDRDMTADPTWQNFGDNFQVDSTNLYSYESGTPTGLHGRQGNSGNGLRGIDYEEGIYLGYKYYETYWAETIAGRTDTSANATADSPENIAAADQWWNKHVAYPFGFGLSYTTFDFKITGVYTDAGRGNRVANDAVLSGDIFASSVGSPAKVKTLYVSVLVKNTGTVAGKTAVQIYATAPYIMNGIEKSFVSLVAFDKTNTLQPGGFQTVTIPVQVQDISSFDYNDANGNGNAGYELDAGEYVLRAMRTSHVNEEASDYADYTFTIDGADAVNLKLDDYTDNLVEPLFSDPTTIDYTIREGINKDPLAEMTIMSRSDLDGTFPKAPTHADQTLKDTYIDDYVRADLHFIAGYTRTKRSTGLLDAPVDAIFDYRDDPSDAWYLSPEAFDLISEGWTQVSNEFRAINPKADIMLREMSGLPLYVYSETGVESINPLWNEFLNQLTWDELRSIASQGMSQLARVDAIEKNRSAARDNTSNLNNIYNWGDQPLLARTYNLVLCAQHGAMQAYSAALSNSAATGWWSPGCNLHRSPFSGRNPDYYGQDSLQAGLILSAVTKAAEENGLSCWLKHFVLNDQETNRNSYSLFTWGSEQTFRENYFNLPQKGFQEGHSSGNMQSFARIGGVTFPYSYAANISLMRDQWGWTGTSVTDHMGGHGAGAFTPPATALNWWDAQGAGGKLVALGLQAESSRLMGCSADAKDYPTRIMPAITALSMLQASR